MERKAHFALIGLVSLVMVFAFGGFIVWLAGAQFDQRYDLYDVAFKGPLRGLSTGGQVFFNGIRIGEVTRLSLDRTDPNKVMARIRVNSDAPVRTDSRAGLEPQGLTGVNYIQISAGLARNPLLKDVTNDHRIPVILASPNALESLLQGGGDVLTRTVEVLDRANRLLSDENINELSGAARDVHAVSQAVLKQARVLSDVDAAALSLRQTSDGYAVLSGHATRLIDGDGQRAMRNLADAAVELKAAAGGAEALIASLKGPAGDLTSRSLPAFDRAVVSVDAAADSLSRLAMKIELDPQGLIAKPPAKTLKVKP